MKQKNLKRICPKCNKLIYYSAKWYLKRAIKLNKICRRCAAKLSYTNEIRKWSSDNLKKKMTGRIPSKQERQKIRFHEKKL